MVIFCFQLFERQVAINRQYAKKEWLSANSQGKLYYFFNISKHFNELLLFVCCLIVSPFHKLTISHRNTFARFLPRTRTHGRPKRYTVSGTICVWNVIAMNVHDNRAKGTHCQGILFSFSVQGKSYIFKNLPLTY